MGNVMNDYSGYDSLGWSLGGQSLPRDSTD